jgi:hypothetical protein
MHQPCCPSRLGFAWVLALLIAPCVHAADPAPVLAGLWEVNLLTSFAPGSADGQARSDLAPRRRNYRICIGPDRAQEPMRPPRSAQQAELVFGRGTISGSYALPGPGGQLLAVEFAYHRLDATRFEGSHDLTQAEFVTRTQYMAHRVAKDCAGLEPRPAADTGEP